MEMTREEAVEELYRIIENQYRSAEKNKEALGMAIEALEKEPCEDCISRQAMLAIVGDSCLDLDSYDDTREFCDEIKELPSVTPQPQKLCEDCISRQAVKELFQEACEMKMYDFLGIDDLPSVTPQPKTGHWIDIMVGDMPAQACDKCNTFYPLAYTGGGHKYCPNCGSKMEVKNDKKRSGSYSKGDKRKLTRNRQRLPLS